MKGKSQKRECRKDPSQGCYWKLLSDRANGEGLWAPQHWPASPSQALWRCLLKFLLSMCCRGPKLDSLILSSFPSHPNLLISSIPMEPSASIPHGQLLIFSVPPGELTIYLYLYSNRSFTYIQGHTLNQPFSPNLSFCVPSCLRKWPAHSPGHQALTLRVFSSFFTMWRTCCT